jgi:hypothetical protein
MMALLCLLFLNQALTAQALNKKISITVKDVTLAQVLQKIQQKYAIRFSYLNNSLPQKQLFSAEIRDQPLSEVLDVLLTKTDIGYLEKNGQVILKKGLPKKKPRAATGKPLPTGPDKDSRETAKAPPAAAAVKPPAPEKAAEVPAPGPAPLVREEKPALVPETTATAPAAPGPAAAAADSARRKTLTLTLKKDALKKLFPAPAAGDTAAVRPYHFGVIYPLSTNGHQASRYVNRFSAHLLAGTAAGLEGFEFAGIGNVEKKYVKGFQLGGVYNIVASPGSNSGEERAANREYTLQGWQAAGVLNISAGKSDGGQIAGAINFARDINGIQIAGLLNKADQINGAQIGGFLNRAQYVKGTQIGFINIADSMAGIPIGLISIVKNNGYRRLELYHADDFGANLTYKIGVPHFYNLLALGAELEGAKRWGYGAGFGAEWTLFKALRLNTDLLSYYVIEDSYENFPDGLFTDYQINLLNKFRLLATLQLARRLALFGGPVYNVFVSEHQDPGETRVGSRLVTNTFYDHTSANGINVKMWIGFNAGLRF